jgi:hypothetical protein
MLCLANGMLGFLNSSMWCPTYGLGCLYEALLGMSFKGVIPILWDN